MSFSKKEISISIEIIFSIFFIIIFMPYFYDNRLNSYDFDFIAIKIIQIVVFSVIYFSLSYSILELNYKKKIIQDERDDLISSKSYKLGYILLDLGIVIVLGHLVSDSEFQSNGTVIFLIISLLLAVSLIKSLFQLYLYKTS
jgi:Ca2+/Na+ antiporter